MKEGRNQASKQAMIWDMGEGRVWAGLNGAGLDLFG